MAKFLIEVPHGEDRVDCAKAIEVFLTSGSHFLTQAEWGCRDNVHSAWIFVELESKAEALAIVPPAFRSQARVVRVGRFRMEQIEPILREHHGPKGWSGGPDGE